jgi:acyl-CoA synthetase (AMP-forming)/AMP-acid ligase II
MPKQPLIICGGQAVTPRDVEEVLLSHPAVAEAVVIGVPDPLGDEIVAAAVRLSGTEPVTAIGLTAYCRARLALHQVPGRWLLAAALPRTEAGEICRGTLNAQLAVMPQAWPTQPAILGLRIPPQVRRSGTLEDLDLF